MEDIGREGDQRRESGILGREGDLEAQDGGCIGTCLADILINICQLRKRRIERWTN